MSIRQYPRFLRYWIGDTMVSLWSQAFQVALFWTIASHSHGAQELGWLSFWSTFLVLAGGPLVAQLFARYGVRRIMVADLGVRSMAYAVLGLWLHGHGIHHL